MWLGGSVTVVAIAVYGRFFGTLDLSGMYLFGAGFVLVATVGAVVPLRVGKWVPTSGALIQIALLVFFTVTVAAYGAIHGVHGIEIGGGGPALPRFVPAPPAPPCSFF